MKDNDFINTNIRPLAQMEFAAKFPFVDCFNRHLCKSLLKVTLQ
jgi:hypothetical protein